MALLPVQVTLGRPLGSMARTQQAAQANITLQEQIEAIHKAMFWCQRHQREDWP